MQKEENFIESTTNVDVDVEINTNDIHDLLVVRDEVYCMDLSLKDVVQLQIVVLYSYANAEWEKIPQGDGLVPKWEPSDIDSDEYDVPLRKKQKAKIVPDADPSKRKHKDLIVYEMVKVWRVSIDEARGFPGKTTRSLQIG